jgi:hypothetical protein
MRRKFADASPGQQERERSQMTNLARGLDEILNRDKHGEDRTVGFVLLVFELGDHGGECNYVSNAERDDIRVLLKELVARFEGQAFNEGNA